MYIFEARYITLDSAQEITRCIEFNGQFLDCERDCYLYAMGQAYDKTRHNEMFVALEFIAS